MMRGNGMTADMSIDEMTVDACRQLCKQNNSKHHICGQNDYRCDIYRYNDCENCDNDIVSQLWQNAEALTWSK